MRVGHHNYGISLKNNEELKTSSLVALSRARKMTALSRAGIAHARAQPEQPLQRAVDLDLVFGTLLAPAES